jgi:radical SAM superfamily enzyme YgiQ (UPF0313 family)
MDILLINPFSWTRDGRPPYLPYGILYLAGYLRNKGFTVAVHDCNVNGDWMGTIDKIRPRFVGLTVMTGPVIKEAIKISRFVRSEYKDIQIIWGGHHPTLFPRQCLDECDYIVMGEGERPLYEFMLDVEYRDIPGLGWHDLDGSVILNDMPDNTIDMNELPMPAWDLVEVEKYVARRHWADRVLTLNTSRGCVNQCAFCVNQKKPHHRFRSIDAARVFNQMMELKIKYCIDGIQFLEDSFDINKKRVQDLCWLIRSNNIKIKWSHFGTIPGFDRYLTLNEKSAGLRHMEFGVESGSDKMLRAINKRQTREQIKSTFQHCRKIGITTSAMFMIGLPDETEAEIKQTVDLIKTIPARFPVCSIYRPYPGTPMYEQLVESGKFKEPQTLEEQADYYAFGELNDTVTNVSAVATGKLLHIQKYFIDRIVRQEALNCIKRFDIKSILYYLRIIVKRMRGS